MKLYGTWDANPKALQDARATEQHTARAEQLCDAIRGLMADGRLTDLTDFLDDHPSVYMGQVLMDWLNDGAPRDGEGGRYWSNYWEGTRW